MTARHLATLLSGVVLGAVLGAGVGAWLVGRIVFWRSGAASPAWREPYGDEYEVTGIG